MLADSLELFHRVSDQVVALETEREPGQYCEDVLEVLCQNLGFPFGAVILLDEWGRGQFFTGYHLGEECPEWVVGPGVPNVDAGVLWVTRISAQAFLTPWISHLNRAEIASIVWVPLLRGGGIFGAFILYDAVIREPSMELLRILDFCRPIFALALRVADILVEKGVVEQKWELECEARKKLEKELRVTQHLSEAASRARNEFLSNMSHEIRTPMNAILGFADILLEEEEDPSKIEALEIIHGAGDNLMALINDILDLTKIESGHIEAEHIHFSLDKLMWHLERTFRPEAEQKGLEFSVTCVPRLAAMVRGDRYKISKIVVSILKNAFKFTRKGRILVECDYDLTAGEAVIAVSDTGIGIPEEKQHLIFKAFKQGDGSTTRHFGGTGLGLTIALKLAQVLGGDITLQSSEGVGTTFTIRLPLPLVEPPHAVEIPLARVGRMNGDSGS